MNQKKRNVYNTNIVVLATHGGYFVPSSLEKKLSDDFRETRLQKNFSDFGTQFVLPRNVPTSQRVIASFSRAIGDPNRSKDSHDFFREYDFGGNKIWKKGLTDTEKKDLIENYYDLYHGAIMDVLAEVETREEKVIVFDIHDTGNFLLGKNTASDRKRNKEIPFINLGNKHGTSCSPEVLKDCSYLLEQYFGESPTINEPYKGGYVTTKYGKEHNDTLSEESKFKRNVIQIELNRSLYIDERTQELDIQKADVVRRNLENVMRDLGEKYSR